MLGLLTASSTAAKAFACYSAACWVHDVWWRPRATASAARASANRRGKPLLNMGAGTAGSSVRVFLMGPTHWGDVNLDIAAPRGADAPDRVTYGDVHSIPYPDGHFGAAIASHLLEHVDDPQLALRELQRVADEVYVIVPKWWCPHTWTQLGHKWFITNDGRCAVSLWQRHRGRRPLTPGAATRVNPTLSLATNAPTDALRIGVRR